MPMDTLKAQRENYLKMDYSPNYLELNSQHLSNLPDFVENCLKMLENFTLMLLNTNDKANSKSKLKYCYCYFHTIRWQLEHPTSLQRHFLIDIAKSIIKRLQNSLGLLDIPMEYQPISHKHTKCRSIVTPVLTKHNICTRRTKRKSKGLNKASREPVHHEQRFYSDWCHQNHNQSTNNGKAFHIQHIIDQMYIQIRAVLSENCIDDADIFAELSRSMKDDTLCKAITETKRLSSITRQVNNAKYQEELWSGDCQVNDDFRHVLSDNLDKIISSNNVNIDVNSLTERIFSSNSKIYFHKNRSRKDSELDEGFSENEYLYDVDNKIEGNESNEFLAFEQFSFCGDCHYNSSNSKSDDVETCMDYKNESTAIHNDDGSDSDGGTELLNSVNETLDKFNAFMQHVLTTDNNTQLDEKSSSDPTMKSEDQPLIDSLWPVNYHTSSERSSITPIQKKSFDEHELLTFDTNSSLSPLLDAALCKDERCEPTISTVNNLQTLSPVSSLSKFSYDSVSKLLVSPVSIQNWCSYNFSPIGSSTCSFGYHTKPAIDVDGNNSTVDNFCAGKLSSWLPPISHGLISTNSYIIGSNHPQQQFHRIMLSPHTLTIPTRNIGPIQHQIVHLPQIFHQIPYTMMDSDYFDIRQLPVNQQQQQQQKTQFSNPNNNNSSCDFLVAPPTISTNSNCSNIVVTGNIHQPISIIKSCVDKSQRACCFYMRGGCKKEDCEYAHDLSKVTCKFWEKGDCFKADTCPFKHGYMKD